MKASRPRPAWSCRSLRQGERLLVSIGIPLLLLVFFSLVDVLPKPAGVGNAVTFLAPGVLALAVMSPPW